MAYIYDLTDTWNAGGTTFYGIKMNVTNTASASGSKLLSLQVGGSEQFGVDKNGNVGVGTSSPGTGTRLNVAGRGLFTGGSYDPFDGTASGVSISYDTGSNVGIIGAVQTGVTEREMRMRGNTLTFFTNATERMRIDVGGNVGIGTSSPVTKLQVSAASGYNEIRVTSGSNSLGLAIDGSVAYLAAFQSMPLTFQTNSAERMRINSSGDMLVNATSDWTGGYSKLYSYTSAASSRTISAYNAGSSAGASAFLGRVDNTAVDLATFYYGASTVVGTITTNGTNTAYNTSSDYRLKDIDGPILNSGAYIDALKPVQGSWKADGSRFIGLIAHEVQEVSETQIATGVKDGDEMQAMDYSAPELIANLIAEIQSLRARVAQLEGN